MPVTKNNNNAFPVLLSIGTILFIYVSLRAYLLSFTWDESYTFLVYVHKNIFIDLVFNKMSGNNHLLNTGLMMLFSKLFGTSEFVLRLPNVLSYLIFLYFSGKIVADFQNKFLVIGAFLIINLNPYLLDFFSLARGYGLSTAFMICSLYYAYIYSTKNFSIRYVIYSLLFGAIGVLSHMTLLNYFLPLVLIFLTINFKRTFLAEKKLFVKNSLLILIVPIIILSFIIPLILKMKAADAFFYGGDSGFWKDTVNSLIYSTLHENSYSFLSQLTIKFFIAFILISSLIIVIQSILKKTIASKESFLLVLLAIITLTVITTYCSHKFFGTKFLIQRTGLYLIPLFNVTCVFLLNALAEKKKALQNICFLVSIFVVINFINCMNFNYVLEWKPDADTKNMIADVEKIHQSSNEKTTVRTEKFFDTPIDFYRVTHNLTWLNVINEKHILNNKNEFYFGTKEGMSNFTNDSLQIIKSYAFTKNVLAARY